MHATPDRASCRFLYSAIRTFTGGPTDDGGVDDADFEAALAAAQAGEDWAVAVLFRDLQPRLLRFLRSQEPRVADDLAAETWLAVATGLAAFNGDEQGFRAWVFTIARRRLIEHRRRSGRRRTDVAGDEVFASLPATDRPDRQALERMAATDAVALITSLLPAEQAEVVLLRVLGQLPAAEVAEIVGRSENWVRVTQHRALKKLASCFDRVDTGSV